MDETLLYITQKASIYKTFHFYSFQPLSSKATKKIYSLDWFGLITYQP